MAKIALTPDKNGPIALFDSGLGGISVLRELLKVLPDENYVFFGDSKNAPYGLHTTQEVHDLTIAHAQFLVERGAKALVIACNTATSAAITDLRKMYTDIPVIGVEPALKPAVLAHPGGKVVVMATPITLKEQKFKTLMKQYESQAEILTCPCPGLVEYVERGELEGPGIESFLAKELHPYLEQGVQALVLGCTHFPLAKEAIRKVCGDSVMLYDGGEGTARHTKRRLEEMGLLAYHDEPEVEIMNSSGDFEMIERAYDYLDME